MVKGAGVSVKGNGRRGRSRKFVAFSRTELYNIPIIRERMWKRKTCPYTYIVGDYGTDVIPIT